MWRPNNRLLNKSRQKHESLKKSRRKFKNSLREMKIETKLYLWVASEHFDLTSGKYVYFKSLLEF